MVFSQDSSFVLLPQDSIVVQNSVVQDSIIIPIDTVSSDSSIKSGLHFFISAGVQFINFGERLNFQNLLNAEYEKDNYPYQNYDL